jgi:hypothetical protein
MVQPESLASSFGFGRFTAVEIARLVSSPVGISIVIALTGTASRAGLDTITWRSMLFGFAFVADARIGYGSGRKA